MTKQDLRDGMIIETVGGTMGIVLHNRIYYQNDRGYDNISSLNDELKYQHYEDDDCCYDGNIARIYMVHSCYVLSDLFDKKNLRLFWSRYKKKYDFSTNTLTVLENIDTYFKYIKKDENNIITIGKDLTSINRGFGECLIGFDHLFEEVNSEDEAFCIDDYVDRQVKE